MTNFPYLFLKSSAKSDWELGIFLDRSTVRPIEIEPMEIGIDRKSYFAKTVDRRPIEDRIIANRTITNVDNNSTKNHLKSCHGPKTRQISVLVAQLPGGMNFYTNLLFKNLITVR